jgi:hypothetical protein
VREALVQGVTAARRYGYDPNLFYQFGLMRDDYTPKPAFAVYRRLIAELGG